MLAAIIICCGSADAQFGGFGKKMLEKGKQKVERKVERTVDRAMDRAVDKAVDKAEDAATQAAGNAIDKATGRDKTTGNTGYSEYERGTADEDIPGWYPEEGEEAQKAELQRRREAARQQYGLGGDNVPEAYKAAYEKVETALATLEAAVESGNDQYVWDDPAGNDAKRALNECLEINRFNREDPRFVEYKQRYFFCKERAADKAHLLAGKPEGLRHMDRTQSKETRLNDFYKLMNWYIATADAAPYARQKE